MLLWCHVFQALCGFFESVRIQEKVTEKNEVKGLFQVGYQGVTFLSLALMRTGGDTEPSQLPIPQGLPPASWRSRKSV